MLQMLFFCNILKIYYLLLIQMVTYTCDRCGYVCKNKSHFKKHLLRKIACHPILCDIAISDIYNKIYGDNSYIILNKAAENTDLPKYAQIRSNTLKYAQNQEKSEKYAENTLKYAENTLGSKSEVKCINCNKIFKARRYLVQHCRRNNCDLGTSHNKAVNSFTNPAEFNKDVIIATQQAVIEELKHQLETLLKEKGNTYTYTQNIIIHPFGKENLAYIKQDYVNQLIDHSPIKCIPYLLKALHFDEEHKENCNVKIPNKKQSFAQIFNGTNWEYKDKRDTIDNMTNKAFGIINKHYDQGTNIYMDHFNEKYENNNKSILKQVTKDTELMILNNQQGDVINM
jgi:hypothetical protein